MTTSSPGCDTLFSYPLNVDEPRVFASSFSANAFMFFAITPLPDNPRGLDMDMMRDFIEDYVRTRLSNVPGVSDILVWGGAERQIRIVLDPARLADHGLTIADVRDAIRARNRDVSGGEIDSGKRRYQETTGFPCPKTVSSGELPSLCMPRGPSHRIKRRR